MQTTLRFLDDAAKVGASLLGLALGAKTEIKSGLKSRIEHWARDMDFVTREEFEVVRTMAQKAREENEKLAKRLSKLEPQVKKK